VRAVALVALVFTACGSEPAERPPPGVSCPAPLVARGDRCVPNVATCGETELPTIDGRCLPVGVDACDEGFEPTGRGGCRAVIASACPAGQMAVPGERACHPVDDCTGIAVDPDAIHVDAAATGTGDGTRDKPFKSLADALAAAKTREGAPMIALARGTYNGPFVAQHAVRIVGACAATTELVAPDGPGTFAFASAFPFELRHVGIRGGDAGGVFLVGESVAGVPAESLATIEHVWVRGSKGIALGAQTTGRRIALTIRDSLIEDSIDTGVAFAGADGLVERTVIRRIAKPPATPAYGAYLGGRASTMTIRRSLIESISHGVGVLSGDARVEGTLLRELRPDAGDASSVGISIDGVASKLTVKGSVIERAQLAGILVARATATVDRTTVTNILPDSDIGVGEGVHLERGGRLFFGRSAIDTTVAQGVFVGDGDATLERVIVRDTQPRAMQQDFGAGLAAQPDRGTSHLLLREVVVRGTWIAGVQINGASLDVESAFITDVRAQKVDGLFGDALAIQSSKRRTTGELLVGAAIVSGLVVRDAKRAGVGVFGATLSLSSSVLECSAIDVAVTERFDSSGVESNPYELRDGGNNVCGCETFAACTARSEGLAPSPRLRD